MQAGRREGGRAGRQAGRQANRQAGRKAGADRQAGRQGLADRHQAELPRYFEEWFGRHKSKAVDRHMPHQLCKSPNRSTPVHPNPPNTILPRPAQPHTSFGPPHLTLKGSTSRWPPACCRCWRTSAAMSMTCSTSTTTATLCITWSAARGLTSATTSLTASTRTARSQSTTRVSLRCASARAALSRSTCGARAARNRCWLRSSPREREVAVAAPSHAGPSH
eukprot:359853-Chlamydomonas_euryale.AAC.7